MSNPNAPAYPIVLHDGEKLPGGVNPDGMTKREEIASRLLAALFANPSIATELRDVDLAENVAFLIDAADDAALQLLRSLEKYPAKEDDE